MSNDGFCVWREKFDPDYWETGCDNAFIMIEGTPTENRMSYCPYCGRPLVEERTIVKPYEDDKDA